MSLNRMAASKPNLSIGCNVTWQASSGVRQSSRNDTFERTAWYSAM